MIKTDLINTHRKEKHFIRAKKIPEAFKIIKTVVCFVNDKVILILIEFSLYDRRPILLIQKQVIELWGQKETYPQLKFYLKLYFVILNI